MLITSGFILVGTAANGNCGIECLYIFLDLYNAPVPESFTEHEISHPSASVTDRMRDIYCQRKGSVTTHTIDSLMLTPEELNSTLLRMWPSAPPLPLLVVPDVEESFSLPLPLQKGDVFLLYLR